MKKKNILNIKHRGDTLCYKINMSSNTAIVQGIDTAISDIIIPSQITYRGKKYIVTSIGKNAFRNTILTSITIPTSVTSIGDAAFAFCRNLKNIEIPNSVTSIGASAFDGCHDLVSVRIPASVNFISDYVFCRCENLTSLIVDKENKKYDSRENCNAIIHTSSNTLIAGCKNTTIPPSVTSIRTSAFEYCNNLISIKIPASINSISNYAFCRCNNLTNLVVDTENIEYDSRENCNAIIHTSSNTLIAGCKNTAIPSSISSINTWAFGGCNNLISIKIPSSVTSIGVGIVSFCNNLASIIVQSQNTEYDSRENCNAIIHTSSNTLIAGCKNTIIPSSVTSIDKEAFCGCSDLTNIKIPSLVTTIGTSAFAFCSNLKSIEIPDSVTSIGEYTFRFCENLTIIEIGTSVTSLGKNIFEGCSSLDAIYSKNTNPPIITKDTFKYLSRKIKLFVPLGCANTYKKAIGWKRFYHIQEYNFDLDVF